MKNKWDWILWIILVVIIAQLFIFITTYSLKLEGISIAHWQFWLMYFPTIFIIRYFMHKAYREVIKNHKDLNAKNDKSE